MIQAEEDQTWLRDHGIILHLYQKLDPKCSTDTHAIASQTLIDIITLSYVVNGEPERANPVLISEMKKEGMLRLLIGYMLNREYSGSVSSLTHGIAIIMELIRKFCR